MRAVRHHLLVLAALGSGWVAFSQPALPQPLSYHQFADQRAGLGIPNVLDVLSNLPFALVGLVGLAVTFGRSAKGATPFHDRWERWPYAMLFGGVALTSWGSAYYHWAPDNARLVWDRLPMSIGFMGLLTAIVAERVSLRLARRLLVPLLTAGAASVVYWYWTELQQAGDLRFYLLVQFGSLILVLLMLCLYRGRYGGTGYLLTGLAAYAGAKGLEIADARVFALGQVVSGHTLKHLAAAGGVACLVVMLRTRTRGSSGPWPPRL